MIRKVDSSFSEEESSFSEEEKTKKIIVIFKFKVTVKVVLFLFVK